jgi:hypothetical protein
MLPSYDIARLRLESELTAPSEAFTIGTPSRIVYFAGFEDATVKREGKDYNVGALLG